MLYEHSTISLEAIGMFLAPTLTLTLTLTFALTLTLTLRPLPE